MLSKRCKSPKCADQLHRACAAIAASKRLFDACGLVTGLSSVTLARWFVGLGNAARITFLARQRASTYQAAGAVGALGASSAASSAALSTSPFRATPVTEDKLELDANERGQAIQQTDDAALLCSVPISALHARQPTQQTLRVRRNQKAFRRMALG